MNLHPFYTQLEANIKNRKNHVCVGLDPDLAKIPDHFPKNMDGLTQFLFEIIEQTADICIAYKPNISFFEGFGLDGLRVLEAVCKKIPANTPIIIDGKRGDIGNTSKMQARYIFDYFGAAATTLHPYMGFDSLEPFFQYKSKYNFVLALTSNLGAINFEKQKMENGQFLYEYIARTCIEWNLNYKNIGLVVGATQEELKEIRSINEDLIFLIPGVGSQGGDYLKSVEQGKNKDDVVLINMSRSILYASKNKDFSKEVRQTLLSYTK